MNNNNFIISHDATKDTYKVWEFDPANPRLLKKAKDLGKKAKLGPGFQLMKIGNYILQWGPLTLGDYYPCYPYRLSEFDINNEDPLSGKVISEGAWPKTKFWHGRVDFGNADGDKKNFDEATKLELLSFNNFVLNWIPTAGRGTYQLWDFDPAHKSRGPDGNDPLPATVSPQGAWGTIKGS